MATGPLTAQQCDGICARRDSRSHRGMFESDEIDLLRRAAKEDRELDQHSSARKDGEGGTVRLSLWNHPGDTLYGMFARCESIVNSAETTSGRRGLSLPLEDDHERCQGRRRLGLASGLRLLVSERRAVPAADERVHCGRSGDARERLPAGDRGLASNWAASTMS